MELLEILNEDGSGTGVYKERAEIHHDGDLHGSSHVWVIGDWKWKDNFSVLLQKRSPDKDAFPNCFDTSCAGHVAKGETFDSTALRELEEELGIRPKAKPLLLFDHRVGWEAEFHGRRFVNNEINRVYLLYEEHIDLDRFQKEEIGGLCWQNAKEVLDALRAADARYCIQLPLFERFMGTTAGMRLHSIHVYECWARPDSHRESGFDEWTCHKTHGFFGTEEAARNQGEEYAEEVRKSDGCSCLKSVEYWLS